MNKPCGRTACLTYDQRCVANCGRFTLRKVVDCPIYKPCAYTAWDLVKLRDRTDLYRVYTYNGKLIFVGINSDTVTDESRDEVVEVVPA